MASKFAKMDEEDDERETRKQQLKAAVHYTVGAICQETAESKNMTFSRQFVASLSDLTFKQLLLSGRDLELFANHAKRSVVKVDDVKLLTRKAPELHDYVARFASKINPVDTNKPKKGKKTKAAQAEETTD